MRTKPAHIEPACPYCNFDHNPDITCRNIAECMQQELPPDREPQPKRKPRLVRDAAGKLIAVR